jgi:hypothetical protein
MRSDRVDSAYRPQFASLWSSERIFGEKLKGLRQPLVIAPGLLDSKIQRTGDVNVD